jgi:hypothetical protein
MVKFDIDGVVKMLEAILGVKQGDLFGPPLFDFYIAAIMHRNVSRRVTQCVTHIYLCYDDFGHYPWVTMWVTTKLSD